MAEKPSASILALEKIAIGLLSVMYSLVAGRGVTISLYTSKKGRVWVACKSVDGWRYSSAAEVDPSAGRIGLHKSLGVAMGLHLAKLLSDTPRVDTWIPVAGIETAWLSTREQIGLVASQGLPPGESEDQDEPDEASTAVDEPD